MHVFHYFARVMFREHIQHRQTVGRAEILLFLQLAQVMFGANVQHR
jgi:hypothetical protein